MVLLLLLLWLLSTREQRQPKNVIHHSDRGSQYTSLAFGSRCKAMGVQPSMGSVGDAYDNAMAETWYNLKRRHSALNYVSPIIFEKSRLQKNDMQPADPIHALDNLNIGKADLATSDVHSTSQNIFAPASTSKSGSP